MKLLMIAPTFGGINVYVDLLSSNLRLLGNEVDNIGSTIEDNPYNIVTRSWRSSLWVKERVENLLNQIDFTKYDLVAFHYGKNDIEQYLPCLMLDKNIKTNSIYFVHYLSQNLFGDYLGDRATSSEVDLAFKSYFKGYVFFGNFAKNYLRGQILNHENSIVSFLPETHSHYPVNEELEQKFETEIGMNDFSNTVFVTGYASNYKDHLTLLESLKFVSKNFNLVFVGRGWQKRLGFKTQQINKVKVFTLDREIVPEQFRFFVEKSLFGIFPYKQPADSTEVFQGSGVLPNYISSNKACIVFNEGCLKEYVADSGIVLDNHEPVNLAKSIDFLLTDANRKDLENKASKIKFKFSPAYHVAECDRFFKTFNI